MASCISGQRLRTTSEKFDVALERHGADLDDAILVRAAVADVAQTIDAIEIDQMVGQHVAHIEHRHQRLAAGKQFRVFEAAKERDDIGGGARIVVRK